MRDALRNRGGAQNVVASVPQAAESEPETGFSMRKEERLPAQGSAGLDWLDLRAFAPKNLQAVVEKLRTDLQPAVIQKGTLSEAEEVTRLHSHYKDALGSASENEDTEVPSASAPSRKGAVKGAGRPPPKAKGKAKATGLKAALQARGGMQRPATTDEMKLSAFEQEGHNVETGGMSPRASSPLASSPLPSVEEENLEAEAADHEAPKEEPDYLVGPVPVVQEATEEAVAATDESAAAQGASSGAAAEEESPLQEEAATADSGDAQNAEVSEDASGDAVAADGADESQARSEEESHEGAGDEQDGVAKAEDKVKKEFAKVVTNTRAKKVESYDFRVQHFNNPVALASDAPIPWKAQTKRGDFRRAATTPVGDLTDGDKVEECGEGGETPKADPLTYYDTRFRENKEAPKKLKDLQDFWGKKSVGFAGPSLGGNKRISKGEAQATLQRLIAAGGAVDFDEVRRLRKLIAELE